MKILIIAWITVVFTACGSQDADQKIITAVNPLDGERYIWIPPGTLHLGCSAKDRDCQDGQIQAFNMAVIHDPSPAELEAAFLR
jgi:hypothetical protein